MKARDSRYIDPHTGRRIYRGRSDGYVMYKAGWEEPEPVDNLTQLAREHGVREGAYNINLLNKTKNSKTGLQFRYYGDTPYNWKD